MKYRTILILVVVLTINLVAVGLYNWQAQRPLLAQTVGTQSVSPMTNVHAPDDEQNIRWMAEMEKEPIEVLLRKLTDAAEFLVGPGKMNFSGFTSFITEDLRESTIYSRDIKALFGNLRFRKAYEVLSQTERKKAAQLLSKNIRDNLKELRLMLRTDMDFIAKGNFRGGVSLIEVNTDASTYRPMAHPDYPPTQIGRRYAVLSYILLASFLELQEVRPAVEEVVQFAKVEYDFFNSLDEERYGSFKSCLLKKSLYNPSLLVTATHCDPTWNEEKKERLEAKLANLEVDGQMEILDDAMFGFAGWILPMVSYENMLKIRYYQGITDAEFDGFFSK